MSEDKHFPIRGKWDFENDDMRLEAIKYCAKEKSDDDYWHYGYKQGFKDGKRCGTAASWIRPLATAAVLITMILSLPQYALLIHTLVH